MIALLPIALHGMLSLAPPTPPEKHDPPVVYTEMMDGPQRRVRTTDTILRALMIRGLQRSTTFGDLVRALNATDVIVYIQRVDRLPSGVAGQLLIVPGVQGHRYLRILVRDHLAPNETIALVGHELQHALEIAAAPDVRDQEGLVDLYQRIGDPGAIAHSFDTPAARSAGQQVRIELVG